MDALRKACEARGWTVRPARASGWTEVVEGGEAVAWSQPRFDVTLVVANGKIHTVVAMLRLLEDHGIGKPLCEVCGDTGRLDDIECPGCGGERPR